MANKIEDIVKIYQKYAFENLKAAWLENSLIFQINNKLILGIDTLTNITRIRTPSIILSSYSKHKRLEIKSISNNIQSSKDTIILVLNFKKSTVVLVVIL